MRWSTWRFDAYLELARAGRTGIWSIVAGVLLVVFLWLLGTAVVIAASVAARAALAPAGAPPGSDLLSSTLDGHHGVFVLMLSIATLWAAVWLAVRLVQRRPFSGILGFERRLRRSEFTRGFLAAALVSGALMVLLMAVDPNVRRTEMPVGLWLAWLGPVALAVLLQASAEELAFRGYLVQILGARFASPLVWAALPAAIFTLAHWDADALPWMNAALVADIGAFAALATILVVRTGSLAAPMGAHVGYNLTIVPLHNMDGDPSAFGLWVTRSLSDPSWTPAQAGVLALVGLAETAVILFLLFHPRSPLRLPDERPDEAAGQRGNA